MDEVGHHDTPVQVSKRWVSHMPKAGPILTTRFTIVVAVMISCLSQTRIANAFESDIVVDFGERSAVSEAFTVSTTLQNQGKEVLQIKQVKHSCDCINASVEPREIAPGAAAKATITVDPRGKPPKFSANVFVYTSDNNVPVRSILVTGTLINAVTDLLMSPPSIMLSSVSQKEKIAQVFVLKRRNGSKIGSVDIRCDDENVYIKRQEVDPSKEINFDPEKQLRFLMEIPPPQGKYVLLETTLSLSIVAPDKGKEERLAVPLRVEYEPLCSVFPRIVVVKGKIATVSLSALRYDGVPLKLGECKVVQGPFVVTPEKAANKEGTELRMQVARTDAGVDFCDGILEVSSVGSSVPMRVKIVGCQVQQGGE